MSEKTKLTPTEEKLLSSGEGRLIRLTTFVTRGVYKEFRGLMDSKFIERESTALRMLIKESIAMRKEKQL